jgi:hypothetical protein
VNKLEILPDKQYLAAAGNPHVRLFEINTNNPNPVREREEREISIPSQTHLPLR